MKFSPLLKRFQNRQDYEPIDLSKTTLEKLNINPQDNNQLSKYLEQARSGKNAEILYGGYLEQRSLYNKKSLFNNNQKQRNIHLGVDFWANADEEIICPMKGKVISCFDNSGKGNYGPTIILQHEFNGEVIYTLYGHLSKKSLSDIKVNQNIEKNEVFCKLGQPFENGCYLPHLHFQIIKDLQNHKNDYPGVCHKADLEFYEKNTISPLTFLRL